MTRQKGSKIAFVHTATSGRFMQKSSYSSGMISIPNGQSHVLLPPAKAPASYAINSFTSMADIMCPEPMVGFMTAGSFLTG